MRPPAPTRGPRRHGGTQRGFLLLGMLVALALLSLVAVGTGQRLADQRQRENEAELLFVGEQYRLAILSFWRDSPGGVRRWPTRLDELLEDQRFPMPRRHLRRLYPDPLAPDRPWGLVTQGAAILGVYSDAPGVPFRRAGFAPAHASFENASRYADWRFLAEPPAPAQPAAGPGRPASAAAGTVTAPSRGAPPPAAAKPDGRFSLPPLSLGKP